MDEISIFKCSLNHGCNHNHHNFQQMRFKKTDKPKTWFPPGHTAEIKQCYWKSRTNGHLIYGISETRRCFIMTYQMTTMTFQRNTHLLKHLQQHCFRSTRFDYNKITSDTNDWTWAEVHIYTVSQKNCGPELWR